MAAWHTWPARKLANSRGKYSEHCSITTHQSPWPQKSLCPYVPISCQEQERQATELQPSSFVIQIQTVEVIRASLTFCRAQVIISTYSSWIRLTTSLHTIKPMQKADRIGLKTWMLMKFPASDRSLPNSSLLCCALFPFPVCLASISCSQFPSHVWALKSCLRSDKFFPCWLYSTIKILCFDKLNR